MTKANGGALFDPPVLSMTGDRLRNWSDMEGATLFEDRGSLSPALFEQLWAEGWPLITKLKRTGKSKRRPWLDPVLLRQRALIEGVNDQGKPISHIEHTRRRSAPPGPRQQAGGGEETSLGPVYETGRLRPTTSVNCHNSLTLIELTLDLGVLEAVINLGS